VEIRRLNFIPSLLVRSFKKRGDFTLPGARRNPESAVHEICKYLKIFDLSRTGGAAACWTDFSYRPLIVHLARGGMGSAVFSAVRAKRDVVLAVVPVCAVNG
jgi:hypothetical protein